MKSKLRYLPFVIGALSFAACGGGGSDDGTEATVVKMNSNPSTVVLNAGSVISVEFSYSANDVIDHGDRVDLVLKLPSGVQYRPGTSDIKRPIDDKQVEPEQVFSCSNGSSFVHYSFGRGELTDATNPSGDADAELRLTLDSTARGSFEVLSQASSASVVFTCDGVFSPQSSALLNVQ